MNNYAVSSDGIATALQDSASALMEAGNNLEQSTALVAAANKVVQDPSSVGSALRTIALRLRGTSVEILEEMGEETDGVVESVSKLQDKIKALTGVDILTDSGTYKDTYTILHEIAEVWSQMSNMDQAAALELMAGKNRANTLAAILNNMEDLEGAYESAMNAEGSALQENLTYLDSIEGKISLVKNSLQTMWMNALDSSFLKFLLDVANALIKIADKAGLVNTAIGAFAGFKAFSNKSSFGNFFTLDDTDFGGKDSSSKSKVNTWFSNIFGKNIADDAKDVADDVGKAVEDMADDVGDSMKNAGQSVQSNIIDFTSYKQAVDSGKSSTEALTGAQVQQTGASTSAAAANRANAGATQAVGISSKVAAVGVRALNAALSMGISMLIGFAVQGLVTWLYDVAHAEEQAADRVVDAISAYRDKTKAIEDQKKTVDELSATYASLSSGVNTINNENIGLTTEAYEEYLDVCNRIADIYPDLITGYDAQGNAILSLQGKVEGLTDAYKRAQEEAAHTLLTKENKEDVWATYEKSAGTILSTWRDSADRTWGQDLVEFTMLDKQSMLQSILNMGYEDFDKLYQADKGGIYDQFEIIKQQLQKDGIDMDVVDISNLFNDFKISDFGSLDQYKSAIRSKLSEINQEISTGMSGIKETVSASLVFDDAYQGLDESSRGIVNSIINNMDPELIAQSEAKNLDEFISWFSSDIVASLQDDLNKELDNADVFTSLNNLSDQMVKAMSEGNQGDFVTAQNSFNQLLTDWLGSDTIEIADTDNAVTKYLKNLAIDIQNQSKNYEVKLQMQTEFDSPIKVGELLTQYTGEYKDEIQDAFKGLNLGDNVTMKDVYEGIAEKLAGEDGEFRADELTSMWEDYSKVIASGEDLSTLNWSEDQLAAVQALDAVMKMYGTDIDTVKAKLIELGIVVPALEDIGTFNLSSESTNELVDQFQGNINSIKEAWNSLNNKEMTKSEFIDLAQEFPELMDGVNLSDDNWMVKAKENLEELNAVKIDDFIQRLTDMKKAMLADDATADTSVVDSFINYANQLKTQSLLDVEAKNKPTTVTALTEAYEGYKTILAETNEILYDGQEVSSDYYESLKEYIDDVEELDSCFGGINKNIVTNTKKLKQLVAQQKQERLNTTRVAKAQSQLQYQKLVRDLLSNVNSYRTLDAEERQNINTLLQQIDTVRDTIEQYNRLELSLLGATDAFDEFQNAQDIDAATDYESTVEGMLQAIGDGFDTGKVGLESFNAAIRGLLSEDIYGDLATPADLDKVWAEFTGGPGATTNLSDFFTYSEDDGFTVTLQNMKNFVAAAQEAGVLTGETFDQFDVVSGTTLKEFADAMGLSEDAVFAFLDTLSNYTIGGEDLLSQLEDVKLDKDIEKATDELAELAKKKAEFLQSGQYSDDEWNKLTSDIEEAEAALESANNAAAYHANLYSTLATIQNGLHGETSLTNEQLQTLASNLTYMTGEQYTISVDGKQLLDANGNAVDIQTMLAELGATPTELQVQCAWEYNQSQLDSLYAELEALQQVDLENIPVSIDMDKDDIQKRIEELQGQITGYESAQNILEIQYGFTPAETSDTSVTETYTNWEANGLNFTATADMTQPQQAADGVRKTLEEPMETTLTVTTTPSSGGTITDKATAGISRAAAASGATSSSNSMNVSVTYKTDTTSYQQVQTDKQTLATNCATPIQQNVNVSDNDTIDNTSLEITNLDNQIIDNKSFNVSVTGTSYVNSQLNAIQSNLAAIDGMSATATVTVNTINSGGSGALGTARAMGNSHAGLQKDENNTIVGEVGEELIVDPYKGIYYTVGQNGTEMVNLPKGAIIYNHKQTEELLKNGHTSRGKLTAPLAFAQGNAHAYTYTPQYNWTGNQSPASDYSSAASSFSNAADSIADSAEEFEEVFDWIEVRLEEINEQLSLMDAQLANAVGFSEQNSIIDKMIDANQTLYDNLIAGAAEYDKYAAALLTEIPEEYREAAQNGAIAIEEFVGEVDEETLTAIQEYRDWVQKGADATQQAEEVLTEISALAKQAIDNIADEFDNKTSLRDSKIDQFEAYNDYLDTDVGFESEDIYRAMIAENNKNIETLEKKRDTMQAELDKRVIAGEIEVGSQDWYDAINDIAAVDTEIIELKTDTEDWQDEINNLHWDKFDLLMDKLGAVSDEAENLIDILSSKDLFDESGNWTDEGITTMGLYAQQMEVAEQQALKYQEQIDYLNKNWKELGYTEEEYVEKLQELKDGQYESIQAANAAKEAIVDLNKERVEAIKDGIQKEIDAYSELIEKKKEELDAEKDLYDFQKSVSEQKKDIADIERQLAALAGDNSASARAKRAQLEAELAEANAALEETYYERSIQNQQEALDKELENFQEEKNAEMEGWDTYLENTEQVVSDSLAAIQENTGAVYTTLQEMGEEYGLSISTAITSPWKDGEAAIQSYSETFGVSASATIDQLKEIEKQYRNLLSVIDEYGEDLVDEVNDNATGYQAASSKAPSPSTNKPKVPSTTPTPTPTTPTTSTLPSKGSTVKVKSTATHFSSQSKNLRMASFVPGSTFNVMQVGINGDTSQILIGKNGSVTGWVWLKDLEGYAKGTTGVDEDKLAWIDELGEELVLHADGSGKLAYLSKGSAVIPHDISENLMKLGQLDPSEVLNRSTPKIGASPSIVNHEVEINMSIAEVVHIDKVTNDTLPDLTKAVEKQLDSYMMRLNNSLKKFTR